MRPEWPSIPAPPPQKKKKKRKEKGTALGQSTTGHGRVAQSRKLFWTENVHVKLLDIKMENWDSMLEILGPVLDSPELISN